MFARHHYLSGEHSNAAKVYIATIDGHICGFCSVIYFPHPKVKNMRKIHRLVVLPDFQGASIGILLLTEVAKIQLKEGFRIGITTSSPSLVFGLKKNTSWLCKSIGRKSKSKSKSKSISNQFKSTISSNRITASFEFKPLPTGNLSVS